MSVSFSNKRKFLHQIQNIQSAGTQGTQGYRKPGLMAAIYSVNNRSRDNRNGWLHRQQYAVNQSKV